jgi:hypothetical protein
VGTAHEVREENDLPGANVHRGNYDVDRMAEMSNCNRTFSLTMAPPFLRR